MAFNQRRHSLNLDRFAHLPDLQGQIDASALIRFERKPGLYQLAKGGLFDRNRIRSRRKKGRGIGSLGVGLQLSGYGAGGGVRNREFRLGHRSARGIGYRSDELRSGGLGNGLQATE